MLFRQILVALLFLTGLVHAAEPLKVLTYNLRYINSGDQNERTWDARRDLVGKMVVEDDADLIGIQEGFRSMLDDLHQRAPGYAEIGGGREDGLGKGEYCAILVKANRFTILDSGTFWLSDTPEIAGSKTWGNVVVRICTWAKLYDRKNQRAFHFFNTHLDHQTPLARLKGTELILSRMVALRSSDPMIFTGDLNAQPNEPLHQLIQAEATGLADVWATIHPSAKPEESGTAHTFSGRTDGARIDYIYASKSFEFMNSEILRDHQNQHYPSDHFPVRATLHFPPAR